MNMESADAQRMRRVRAHKKGDHSLCTAKTCAEAMNVGAAATTARAAATTAVTAPVVPADGDRLPGGIETAVLAFVAALPYREADPRYLLAQIAVRLAQRVDETGAMPAAVRELRTLLVQLVEAPNGPAGVVDEVRLRSAQRKLDNILATAA